MKKKYEPGRKREAVVHFRLRRAEREQLRALALARAGKRRQRPGVSQLLRGLVQAYLRVAWGRARRKGAGKSHRL